MIERLLDPSVAAPSISEKQSEAIVFGMRVLRKDIVEMPADSLVQGFG